MILEVLSNLSDSVILLFIARAISQVWFCCADVITGLPNKGSQIQVSINHINEEHGLMFQLRLLQWKVACLKFLTMVIEMITA